MADLPADAIREAAMKGRRRAERQRERIEDFDDLHGTNAASFIDGMQQSPMQSEMDALAKHLHQLPWPAGVDPDAPDPLTDDPLVQELWGKRPEGVPSPAALKAKHDFYSDNIERRAFDAATATEPEALGETSEEVAQRLAASFVPAPRDAGAGTLTAEGLREMFEKGGTRGVYDVADALGAEFLRQHPDADLREAEQIASNFAPLLRMTPEQGGGPQAFLDQVFAHLPRDGKRARAGDPPNSGRTEVSGGTGGGKRAATDADADKPGDMIAELGKQQRALNLY